MAVRISANDWAGDDGVTPAEAVEIARAFSQAGADLIDVSAGQTWAEAKPVYGRMFQTPFADRIRNEARLATMAVGNIYEADHANSILAAGRADLVALARPHLVDPDVDAPASRGGGYDGAFVPAALSRRTGAIDAHPARARRTGNEARRPPRADHRRRHRHRRGDRARAGGGGRGADAGRPPP